MKRHERALVNLIYNTKLVTGVGAEIGVWKGDLSKVLLGQFPNRRLIMVDAWDSIPSSNGMMGCVLSDMIAAEAQAREMTVPFGDRAIVIKASSMEASEEVPNCSLDYVFIDANHSYESVLQDLIAWEPKLRDGGLLSGHDYNGLMEKRGRWGVKRAVMEFLGYEPSHEHLVWWTHK